MDGLISRLLVKLRRVPRFIPAELCRLLNNHKEAPYGKIEDQIALELAVPLTI